MAVLKAKMAAGGSLAEKKPPEAPGRKIAELDVFDWMRKARRLRNMGAAGSVARSQFDRACISSPVMCSGLVAPPARATPRGSVPVSFVHAVCLVSLGLPRIGAQVGLSHDHLRAWEHLMFPIARRFAIRAQDCFFHTLDKFLRLCEAPRKAGTRNQ